MNVVHFGDVVLDAPTVDLSVETTGDDVAIVSAPFDVFDPGSVTPDGPTIDIFSSIGIIDHDGHLIINSTACHCREVLSSVAILDLLHLFQNNLLLDFQLGLVVHQTDHLDLVARPHHHLEPARVDAHTF